MKQLQEQHRRYTAGEKKVKELYHHLAMQIGISDSALWTLCYLFDSDTPHTQNSIALHMGVAKQTINSAIRRLRKDGYIELKQMAVARNNKQILLTEQGKAFCRTYISPIMEAECKAFDRLPEAEQEIYLTIGIKHNQFLMEALQELFCHNKGPAHKDAVQKRPGLSRG